MYLERENFYKLIKETMLEIWERSKNKKDRETGINIQGVLRQNISNTHSDLSEQVAECVFRKMYDGKEGPYQWNQNSCYIDAILVFMLFSKYNFWRKKIREAADSTKKSFEKTLARSLLTKDTCIDVRKMLHKKDSRVTLKEIGEAVTFYEIVADVFSMKFKDRVEYVEYRPDATEVKKMPDVIAVSPLVQRGDKVFYQNLSFLYRYRRVGIIIHSGAHYTCYFISHGGWVYYDDLAGKFSYKTPNITIRGELEFYIRKDKIDEYL